MAKVEKEVKRKVVAVFAPGKFGYFGERRVRDGDKLDVTKQEFSSRWMKLAEGERAFPEDEKEALPTLAIKTL